MDIEKILSAVDHTILSQAATWDDVRQVCDDGIRYKTASVCIPASYVKKAAQYVDGRVKICTVIGFPNGYSTTASKCFEAADAVANGADEVDMVINIGWLKDKRYGEILDEIKQIKSACQNRVLKVIIETCMLTDEEKIKMCEIISDSGADFIKTSTGFGGGGATKEDVTIFARHVSPDIKIKAAGGIKTLADAEEFLKLGASRLGTSSIIKIVKQTEGN